MSGVYSKNKNIFSGRDFYGYEIIIWRGEAYEWEF
jgi:hypothetical protein